MEHGVVCSTANFFITEFVRAKKLGRVMGNDSFIRTKVNPERYRGADVCFVSYAKFPKDAEIPKGPLPVPPDLVIEVRSPSDRISEMTDKALEYIKAGVTVAIILDPETESLALFREDEFPIRMHNSDELTLPEVLPGFSVEVRKFFE
jgi:Uma2 family endonuclease